MSKHLKVLGFIISCFYVNKSLGNSHNAFHKKYSSKYEKFRGRKSENFVKCFPCALKLKEKLDINMETRKEEG